MYGTSGKISSPLYPSLYPNNQDCMYIIEIPTKQQVHLSFNTFSLEPNPQCLDRGDFLEVTSSLAFTCNLCMSPEKPRNFLRTSLWKTLEKFAK